MNRTDFDEIVQAAVARTADLLVKKGAEYADDVDRLANFKRNAQKNGQTVLETWQTYWGKHIDAINSYMARVKDRAVYLALQEVTEEFERLKEQLPVPQARSISDKLKMRSVIDPECFRHRVDALLPEAIRYVEGELSEPIEGRFDDNINYSFLCMGILQELRDKEVYPITPLIPVSKELG